MKNLKSLFVAITALAVALTGCAPVTPASNSTSDTPAASPTQPDSGSHFPSRIAQSSLSRESSPSVPQSDMQSLVNGNNIFALDLYQSLAKQNGNLIYSPFSISLALAMTYAGARGATESQMTDTLHFTLGQTSTHPAFNAIDLKLAQSAESMKNNQVAMQLNIANAVWAEQTYPFQQDFLDTIALNYGAGIQLADFINQYEPTREEINTWVSDQTNKKIQDLLAKGTLNSATRMVLVNAIYFKADWWTTFDPNNTHDAPFHLLDGSEAQVKMMSNSLNSIPYTSADGYQAVELPYAGGTAAMDILVPAEGKFAEFESSLNADKLNEILKAMQPASVQLGLPKFKFASEFSLPDQLSALGMTDAFDPNLADFSGMTGNRDLFISDVVHKAFVAVDEKGTEAAAATAAIMQLGMVPVSQTILTIDRPFIFVIRDTISGQILFMGRVVNPAN
jgi:serpin B